MVASMKEGAVIVDVSIDQGGCFETSKVTNHKEPIFYKYGIVHYCVPNISSLVSKTASTALSHVLTPILLNVNRYRGIQNLIQASMGTRHGVYIYKGRLTNEHLGERFGLKSMKIDLLITSSF
jgi:alanine dehydrogenase